MKRGLWEMALGLSLLGCSEAPLSGGCTKDSSCAPAQACLARVCVAKSGPRVLHVVAVPAPGIVAAPSEVTGLTFNAGAPPVVKMSRALPVAGKVTSLLTAPFAFLAQGELAIQAVVPSRLKGLEPLSFTALATIKGPGGVADFVLSVPEARLGEPMALVALSPRAPADAVVPPITLPLPLVAPMVVALTAVNDLRVLEGTLRNEFDQPALGYVAQVLRAGKVVSVRAVIGEDGRFRVSFPKLADSSLDAPVLTLSLPGAVARPRLFVQVSPAATELGTVRLPAHPTAQIYRVPVVRVDENGVYYPVVGALVRFETSLPSTGIGVTSNFVQEVQSGKDGTVDVPLIAGGLENVREYRVEVTSHSEAEASSRCIPAFAIGSAAVDATTISTTAVIELPRRPSLAGFLRRPDQSPLHGAVVTAVRLGPLPDSTDCAVQNRLGDAVTSTDVTGAFRLRVDAGRFRVEVRPPTGEAIPYSTWDVTVTNEGLQTTLVLPVGQVADGRLVTHADAPCAACRVLIYEGDLSMPAILRAETVSDPNGAFRVLLPLP